MTSHSSVTVVPLFVPLTSSTGVSQRSAIHDLPARRTLRLSVSQRFLAYGHLHCRGSADGDDDTTAMHLHRCIAAYKCIPDSGMFDPVHSLMSSIPRRLSLALRIAPSISPFGCLLLLCGQRSAIYAAMERRVWPIQYWLVGSESTEEVT